MLTSSRTIKRWLQAHVGVVLIASGMSRATYVGHGRRPGGLVRAVTLRKTPVKAARQPLPPPASRPSTAPPPLPAALQTVTLERMLPYSIQAGVVEVEIAERYPTVHDSGVEGITFKFKWEWYGGHHCVSGLGRPACQSGTSGR